MEEFGCHWVTLLLYENVHLHNLFGCHSVPIKSSCNAYTTPNNRPYRVSHLRMVPQLRLARTIHAQKFATRICASYQHWNTSFARPGKCNWIIRKSFPILIGCLRENCHIHVLKRVYNSSIDDFWRIENNLRTPHIHSLVHSKDAGRAFHTKEWRILHNPSCPARCFLSYFLRITDTRNCVDVLLTCIGLRET